MKKTLLFLSLMVAFLTSSLTANAVTVYFEKPSDWGDAYAYVYQKGGSEKNHAWPGETMTLVEGNLYKYDVPSALTSGELNLYLIVNNNNGKQYPANNATTGLLEFKANDMIVAKSGANWYWTEYESADFTVYFNNSGKNFATPTVHYFGVGGATDKPMTVVSGKLYQATVPAGTYGLVFRNSENWENQTDDFVAKKNHLYNESGDQGVYAPGTAKTVYFDDRNTKWETNLRIHYWGGLEQSTWPGDAMTPVEGKADIYSFTLPLETTGIIFSNNGGNQTDNIEGADLVDNHIYKADGSHEAYTGTVSVELPSHLYIIGNIKDKSWKTSDTPELTRVGETNTFKAENVEIVAKTGAKLGDVTLITALGADWNAVNGSDRYGAAADNVEVTPTAEGVDVDFVKYTKNVDASAAKNWSVKPGKYTITVNFDTNKVTFAGTPEGEAEVVTGAFDIDNLEVLQGSTGNLQIRFNSTKQMKGLQMDIVLPENVVETVGTPILSDIFDDHKLFSNYDAATRTVHMLVVSPNNTEFGRNDAVLMYLPLTIKSDAVKGDYGVTLTNIVMSDLNLNPAQVAACTNTKAITVKEATYKLVLNPTQVAVAVDGTATITAKVINAATNEEITVQAGEISWSSANTAVAEVLAGVVTGKSKGTTTVTATWNTVNAVANVTVGKNPNVITWNTAYPEYLALGEEIIIKGATASSGNKVTYTVVSGASLVTFDAATGKLTANGLGTVTVQASEAGDDDYAPANPVSKTFIIRVGDVNGDHVINLADVTTTIDYILGKNPTNFNKKAANMNQDKKGDEDIIDVVDVTLIIQYLLDNKMDTSDLGKTNAIARAHGDMEQFHMALEGNVLVVNFTDMQDYRAAMFDLTIPAGCSVSAASVVGSGHGVSFQDNGNNTYRFIVWALSDETFAENGSIQIQLFPFVNGTYTLTDAVVDANIDGVNKDFAALGTSIDQQTGINTINAANGNEVYYNMQGVRVVNPENGVYIKVVNGKAEKVVLK